jgi:predicted dehydrogenase
LKALRDNGLEADAPLKVGIVGCGNVVVNDHAPALHRLDSVDAVAVSDPVRANRERVLSLLGLPPEAGFETHRAMLEAHSLDYALVATPPHIRGQMVADCAAGNIHVLSEKPLATRPAVARELEDAMSAAGLRSGMVHNYLYYPEYVLLRKLIASGAIGELRHITLNFLGVPDNPGSQAFRPQWRHDPEMAGGGVLMDMIHALYLAEYLVGEEMQAVSAVIDNLGYTDGQVEDLALLHLYFRRSYGSVNMAWADGPGGVEVAGNSGRIMVFYRDHGTGPFSSLDSFTLYNKEGSQEFQPRQSQGKGQAQALGRSQTSAGNFVAVHEEFARAVREDRPPIASFAAGRRTLETAMAAYASAVEGGVIPLPLSSDHPVYNFGLDGLRQVTFWSGSRPLKRGLFGLE